MWCHGVAAECRSVLGAFGSGIYLTTILIIPAKREIARVYFHNTEQTLFKNIRRIRIRMLLNTCSIKIGLNKELKGLCMIVQGVRLLLS